MGIFEEPQSDDDFLEDLADFLAPDEAPAGPDEGKENGVSAVKQSGQEVRLRRQAQKRERREKRPSQDLDEETRPSTSKINKSQVRNESQQSDITKAYKGVRLTPKKKEKSSYHMGWLP